MKELLQIKRIEAKINEILRDKIDMSDLDSKDATFQTHLYSRALAALAVMKCAGIDADIAAKSITDGYNDIGIDAVYNDMDQKKLILVQSKWRSGASGAINQSEMLTFVQGINRIIEWEMAGCNERLLAKMADIETAIKDIHYQIEVVFCHTGNQRCSDYVKKPMIDLLNDMNEANTELLLFSELTVSDIYGFLSSENGEIDISIDDVLLENWGFVDKPILAYYGTISADVVGGWYMKYGNKLFDKNIRYYKGSTEVNSGIQEVLHQEPDKFFYYNNGIKILCRRIDRKIIGGNDNKAGLFHLEGVSLVNGAQTTGSIGLVYNQNPSPVKNAKLLIQMIDLRDEDADSAKQITRLTNTQNRIDSKDFAALDPQQERIKEELLFDNIQYLYKSGAVVSDSDHQISFEEAIVAQACASGDIALVHLAKQNVGALTEDIARKPYVLLFNSSTNSRALVNNVRTLRLVEKYLQNRQKIVDGRQKCVVIQGNRVLLYLVLKEIKHKFQNYNAELINFDKIEPDINRICEDYISRINTIIDQRSLSFPSIMIFKSLRRTKELIIALGMEEPYELDHPNHNEDLDKQLTLDLKFDDINS